MTENRSDKDRNYRKVNPEDYYGYEEQFISKGGGGGDGSKGGDQQGAKTRRARRKKERLRSQERRRNKARESLRRVMEDFPSFDHPEEKTRFLAEYLNWVVQNLHRGLTLDSEQLEETRSKSSGPGGQHVNKRETRVTLHHRLTGIQAASDQARSQHRNRKQARKQLEKRLENHLEDWRRYLSGGKTIDLETIRELIGSPE